MFLAAAYRALASTGGWNGASALRISMTVDLRRWCLPRGQTPTICNLSSFEHPFLIRNLGRDFDATLAHVTWMTRRRKSRWPGLAPALIGHFFTRRKSYQELLRDENDQGRSKTDVGRSRTVWRAVAAVMSNEGRLDEAGVRFGTARPVAAHILPPFLKLPDLHICLSGYNGALTLAAVTPENGVAGVESFLDACLAQFPAEEPVGGRDHYSPLVTTASKGTEGTRSGERQLA